MDRYASKAFDVRIAQWNAQSLRPKLCEFELLLNREKIHIAIISESWLEPNSRLHISDYNIYRCDRNDSYGGVAIIVHKSVKSMVGNTQFNISQGIEILHVQILNCQYLKNIVAMYCPSTVRTNQSDWDQIFSQFQTNSIILGDFNGHHCAWSYKTDTRGVQIFDSSLDNGYISLNDGSATRVKLVNGNLQSSSPDVTFCSSDLATNLSWSVTSECLGSDHLIIRVSFRYQESLNFIEKRNYKKADWVMYTNSLTDIFADSPPFADNVQEMYDWFLTQINSVADTCIPIIKICTNPQRKFTPKHYWNQNLSKIVAERRLALKSFRKNPTPDNLITLERKVAEAQRLIRKAKAESWQSFCSSIDEATSVSDMWRKMRWMKGFRQSRVIASQDRKIELLRSLTPDFVLPPMPSFSSANSSLECLFSIQELENCLKNKQTAPGDDKISYAMLVNLPLVAKKYLLRIFNLNFLYSYVPTQWKLVQIVPIPKNGTDSNSKLRPIALISCVCKLLHTMINRRLEWYLEKHQMLSPNTIGFRRAQSCLDNLTRLVSSIQIGFSKNNPTIACFVDVEGAYNNVLIESVVRTLDRLQAGSLICKYLWAYLSERHLKLKCEEQDDSLGSYVRWTSRGIAQGDPLSPLLFNVVTIDICHRIVNVSINQYADDFVLYVSRDRLSDSVSDMQSALNCIVVLFRDLGLEVSCNKTKLCVFQRGFKKHNVQISINNRQLESLDCIKYLGIWLDKSLRWGRHVNEICEKASKFLQLLKVLSGSGWGVHPKHARNLYISLIRSRIDYGSFLYDNSANTHLLKLDKVQNQAMRAIGGYIKSTPIHVMQADLCIPPLNVRRQYLGFKYSLKCMSFQDNPTITSLAELSLLCSSSDFWNNKKKPLLVGIYDKIKEENICTEKPLGMFNMDTFITNINIIDVVRTGLEYVKEPKSLYDTNVLKCSVMQELSSKYNGWHTLFTDGSKNAVATAGAYYDPSCNASKMFQMNKQLSIMNAELVAIDEALAHVVDCNRQKLVVLSDSKSSLSHLIKCVRGGRGLAVAYNILNKLYHFEKRGLEVKIQWVPSHIGIKGNEEADMLAKRALVEGSENTVKPHYTELLGKYRKKCQDSWNEYFDERSKEKGIWFRSIQCEPPRFPWFCNVDLRRSQVVMALRLRSGHIPTNKFGFLMKKVPSPDCDLCGKLDDVFHFLVECGRNADKREELFRMFNINSVDVGVFQSILSEPWSSAAKLLFLFRLNI